MEYGNIFKDVVAFSESLGISIVIDNGIDGFFKGDLDGSTVFISQLSDEENLFNVLHMVGHTIQWNVSPELRELGNVVHVKPNVPLLRRLQHYEFEANCYGLQMLHSLGYKHLDDWLELNFRTDMLYLTHFYLTGEKLRQVTPEALEHVFERKLFPKEIPQFTPMGQPLTRNGIVINFTN